nr:tigger transposable element-derived protein 4 [Crassostrea gigas]
MSQHGKDKLPTPGLKRKLKTHTIETKFQAIADVERGIESKAVIAKKYEIPPNTLSTWIKNAQKIKEAYEQSTFGPQRKKMRTAAYKDTEEAVLQWFKTARDQNVPVSGPLLIAKAQEFASQLGDDFKCSTGWLERFKKRHSITFKRVCGESKSVADGTDAMKAWASSLQTILAECSPSDIFNADETGLFFRLLPDKTLEFKGVDCHGGKNSKERVTVMVCSNMSGNEKLPLLVIGKSKKPRCFKGIKTLPTAYEANKKAWITSELFTAWLKQLDRRFQRQKRKVAMIVDNCPAHPKVKDLKAITLFFLPPNTTSKTQLMDQGIIQNLKIHYRKLVIMKQLKSIERNKELQITVLDALRMLYQSHREDHQKLLPDEEDPEDDIPLAALRLRVPFDDYAQIDETVITTEAVSDKDIVDNIIAARHKEAEEEVSEPTEPPKKKPTLQKVDAALEVIQDWIEMTEDTEDLLPSYQKIHRRVTSAQVRASVLVHRAPQ